MTVEEIVGHEYSVIFFNGVEHRFRAPNDQEAQIALEEQYYAYGADVTPDDVIWWGRSDRRPDLTTS